MSDEKVESAMEIAERLLPCTFLDSCADDSNHHMSECPAFYRAAVAEAIEAAVEPWQGQVADLVAVNDVLKAEVERLQADLATAPAERENQLAAHVECENRLFADLATAEATRIDPQAYRDLEIRIQALEYENEKLRDDVTTAEAREREECAGIAEAYDQDIFDYTEGKAIAALIRGSY